MYWEILEVPQLSCKEGQPHKTRLVKTENQSFQERGTSAVGWSGAGVTARPQVLGGGGAHLRARGPVPDRPMTCPASGPRSLSHPSPNLPALLTSYSDELMLEWESVGASWALQPVGKNPAPLALVPAHGALRAACFRLGHEETVRRDQSG